MGSSEILNELVVWTPFLAGGFVKNLYVSYVSMFIGTILGWVFAIMRHSPKVMLKTPGNIGTDLFRNIPSFVFMFYLAFVMPVEFNWDDQVIKIPVWIKAALALTVPVIGFASDQTLRFFKDREEGAGYAVLMFVVAWTQYFLIIIMASSTASVIGVDEILARANTVITAIREPEFMLWMYLYVALWFLSLGIFVAMISSLLLKRYGHK